MRAWVGIVAVGLSGCCCGLGGLGNTAEEPPAASTPPKHVPTPAEAALAQNTVEADAEGEKVIKEATARGILRSIDYEGANAVVGPNFYVLEFKDREFLARIVATSIVRKTKKADPFALYLLDSMTNKRVGTLSGYTWKLELE